MKIIIFIISCVMLSVLTANAYQTKDVFGNYVDSESSYLTKDAFGSYVNSKDNYLTKDAFGNYVNSKDNYQAKDASGNYVNSKDNYQAKDAFGKQKIEKNKDAIKQAIKDGEFSQYEIKDDKIIDKNSKQEIPLNTIEDIDSFYRKYFKELQ